MRAARHRGPQPHSASRGTGRGSASPRSSARSPPPARSGCSRPRAWLISRSAQRPQVLYLMAPAAVVQAFGLGRAVPALRRAAGRPRRRPTAAPDRRRAYDALARLAPAGLAGYRSGDLIARLVADIDSLADRWLRVRLPYAAAALAGDRRGRRQRHPAARGRAGPRRRRCVVSALAAPAVAIALSRREERALAPLRGELAAATWTCSTARRNSPPSARTGALAAVQDKGARVGAATRPFGLRAGRGGGGQRARGRGGRLGRGLSSRVPAVRAGALPGCCSRWSCSPRSPRTRCSPGSPPAAQEVPRLRAAPAGSRRCWTGPPRWPSRPRRPPLPGRRTTWPSAACHAPAGAAGAEERAARAA